METRRKKTKQTSIIRMAGVSALIGIVAGLVTVMYRYALTMAEGISETMYSFMRNNGAWIPVLFIGLALLAYCVGWLTQKYSLISGSGIPQLKAQITGYIKGSWLGTLIAKFVGGTLSILGGLSLGREGPSIQLGACVADGLGGKLTTSLSERRMYLASGASAGLASAFNAPLAGIVFSLEEIFKYFSSKVLLSTMIAAISADVVSKLFFGTEHVFHFNLEKSIPIKYYALFIVLGIILGLSGVIYNVCLDKTQKLFQKCKAIPARFKLFIPFFLAGILGLTFPVVLGGGHALMSDLSMQTSLLFLVAAFMVKFLFSMISFGSGAAGGIFFPMLVLGSALGAIFAKIIIPFFGLDEVLFYNFIIIAMAGYFTAIVRAPLTGIILMIEMTGTLDQLLPLIITSAIAYITAETLKNKPVYETLFENLLQKRGIHKEELNREKILIETVVHMGSSIDNKAIKDINVHEKCLIVSVMRGDHDITPNGNTVIKAGDCLTVLTSVKYETEIREQIESYSVN